MRSFRFADIPLNGKLMFYFIALALLPVCTLGIMAPFLYGRSLESETTAHTTRMISQVTRGVEFYARETERLIDLLASTRDVRALFDARGGAPLDSDTWLSILGLERSIVGACPELAGALVLTASDELVTADYTRVSRDSLLGEIWYTAATRSPGAVVLLPRPFGRNLRNVASVGAGEVISVVKAFTRGDGAVAGVILIDLRISVVEEVFRDTALGKSGFLFIADPSGEMVYAPYNPVIYRVPLSSFSGDEATHLVSQDGVDYQVISRRSPYTGWRTFGVFSLDESLRAVNLVRLSSILLGLVTLFAAAVAAAFLTRSICAPILSMERLMKRAELGDLSVRFSEGRADEIGQLGHGFNSMIATMQELIDQVVLEQRLKREAELRILQEQIKPHFLYNTLDTIQWMAHERGADDVVCLVEALSTLFRIGLSRGQELIPLSDELKHVESYLCIQKARYEDKFDYRIESPVEIGRCRVVRLILQPLVENAIYHGIKERRGHGNLLIEALREGDVLLLRVTDDGLGMSGERIEALNRALESGIRDGVKGYGIHNVNERIRLSWGRGFGLSFRAARGGGTVAEIRHPIVEGEA